MLWLRLSRRRSVDLCALVVIVVILASLALFLLLTPDRETDWAALCGRVHDWVFGESPKSVTQLVGDLGDSKHAVRTSAVRSLVEIGPPAVPDLIKALNDDDPTVCRSALSVLVRLGPDAQLAVPDILNLLEYPAIEVRLEVLWALWHIAGESDEFLQALQRCLYDPDQAVREEAIQTVKIAGPAGIPILIDALSWDDDQMRRLAAGVAGDLGPSAVAAVPALIDAARQSEDFGPQAAWAIAKVGVAGLPIVVDALHESDVRIRRVAAESLGKMGMKVPEAAIALRPALRDEDAVVRRSAVAALAGYNPMQLTVSEFAELLRDTDSEIRAIAARSLGRFGPEAKEAVPALMQVLSGTTDKDREMAAQCLGLIGEDASVALPILRDLMLDGPRLRIYAAFAVARIESDGADGMAALVMALQDTDREIVQLAVQILENLEEKAVAAVPSLLALLDRFRGNLSMQMKIARSLREIDPQAWADARAAGRIIEYNRGGAARPE